MNFIDINDALLEEDYLIPLLKHMKQGKKIKVKTWLRKLENIFSRSSAIIIRTSNSLVKMHDATYILATEAYVLKDFTISQGKLENDFYALNDWQLSDLNIIDELSDMEIEYVNILRLKDEGNPQKKKEIWDRLIWLYCQQLHFDRYREIQQSIMYRIIEETAKYLQKQKQLEEENNKSPNTNEI
ncbi:MULTISPECIES: hypothetical protein [Calothrix]|uniref:Uncharacterized protein n=2 Tax=Calothrix TaxID=1186 RepID=A0ABR8AAA1_9CYAN|nr:MULTISPECIES: hypothetical protein [Calothrix]MBD2196594.1 hypothetical protein [Calothrix parietina FACHB-288]MBD2228041.1 hypothetical protein [Calothrix anomala FACHB-343]